MVCRSKSFWKAMLVRRVSKLHSHKKQFSQFNYYTQKKSTSTANHGGGGRREWNGRTE